LQIFRRSKASCGLVQQKHEDHAGHGAQTTAQESGTLIAADVIIDRINRYAPNLRGGMAGIAARQSSSTSSA
jgi:hypothetical protein